MSDWFGPYWDKTLKDARGNVELESQSNEHPLSIGKGAKKGIIQFTSPIYGDDETRPVGLIGIHFRRDLFKLLIEPLTQLSEQSKSSVHTSFWVYSEH